MSGSQPPPGLKYWIG